MTTDERIDKLVERHEALTESVEMLRDSVKELRDAVADLRILTGAAVDSVGQLATIASAHEVRISRLERTA